MNVQSVNFQDLLFINVVKPTEFEMKFLKNTCDFNPLNLEDYLHRIQIPKIESHKDYELLVLRFPILSDPPGNSNSHGTGEVGLPAPHVSSAKRRLSSNYVDFFVSEKQVVVLHEGVLPKIEHIFSLCQQSLHNRTEYMGKGPVFLVYRIIDALIDDCFPIINDISSTIDLVDKELDEKQSQETLENISVLRRNLVVFHTMIKPIIPLLEDLKTGKHQTLNGSMQPFWKNTLDHLQKILDRVEDNRELIEGISRSNESLLAARNNEIVKFLTVITSVAFPFVVMNNLYSMNIAGLPFAQSTGIVWVMFAIMLGGGFTMLFYFKFKKWL